MQNAMTTILVLSTLCGVFSAGVAAAEDAAPRQRPSPEQRAQRIEQMQQRWNRLDTNHDGMIGKQEAQQGAPRLAEHFDQLDANGDGQLTHEELRQAHQARQAHSRERPGPKPTKPQAGS